MTTDRLPPYSQEAEAGVLGCILRAPSECLDDCAERLRGPEAFYNLPNQTIYATLVEMQRGNESIDIITVQQRLKDRNQLDGVGGLAYLSALPDQVPSVANLEYYLAIVEEKHLLRLGIKVSTEFVREAFDSTDEVGTVLDRFEQNVIAIRQGADGTGTLATTGRQNLTLLTNHLEFRYNLHHEHKSSGLTTGFYDFDLLTDGLQAGEMTIIAARPSAGKTAIAMNMVERICLRDKVPTLVVSCEMSRAALLRRMLAGWEMFPLAQLKSGAYTEEDFARFVTFNATLMASPLYLVEALGGINCERLAALVRRMWRKHGIKLMVLDYLQKVQASQKHEKRTYEVAEASGVIKSVLQETSIAGLVLAQLNRESERDKGRLPRISDLADSGRIEQDADTVGLLHRDRKENPGEAKLIICKQRDGEVGIVDLLFEGKFCKFQNKAIHPADHPAPQPHNDP